MRDLLILIFYVINDQTNSVVGSAAVKGISGGQKKRVSVAMELMKVLLTKCQYLLDILQTCMNSGTFLVLS